ncbi:hypothetical protein ASE14_08130 [Agromyces sp. Root81]|uniref:hypothetical protein n=1 Tax=Agromyces sp. Root81 TaxID=1736601 RepID=UPI0006FDB201|nr:hypothetical protein [Agromyces sp. Root81]KRC60918.1 hypothetical protein ASE14_08130 [Agromyces sp. Root81]
MTTIATKPFFIGASTLTVAADDHTSAINSAQLDPTTPTAQFRDIGGGIVNIEGTPSWVLSLGIAQDWEDDTSTAHYMRINAGQTKAMKLTPVSGGRGVTVNVICRAPSVGGAAAAIAQSTLQLPVNGQPVWDPEA